MPLKNSSTASLRDTVPQSAEVKTGPSASLLAQTLAIAIIRGIARLAYGLWGLLSRLSRRQIAAIVIILTISGASYGVYEKYFNLSDAERAQKELAKAVAAVSKLMLLPEGDEPVLATVTDAESLAKQQAFFAGAVNGDQLLLFPKNLKAVIYSPSRNKIINAGPIEQQRQPTETQLPPVAVEEPQTPISSADDETAKEKEKDKKPPVSKKH